MAHIPEPHEVTTVPVVVLSRDAFNALYLATDGQIMTHSDEVAAAGYSNFLLWPNPWRDTPICFVLEYTNPTDADLDEIIAGENA